MGRLPSVTPNRVQPPTTGRDEAPHDPEAQHCWCLRCHRERMRRRVRLASDAAREFLARTAGETEPPEGLRD